MKTVEGTLVERGVGAKGSSSVPQGALAPAGSWLRPILLLYLIPLVSMGAMVNFAPFLPLVRDELNLSNAWAGMLASTTIFAHTLLQLPGGQIAVSLGVRRSILLGQSVVGLGVLGSGLAPSVELLLLCRFVVGLGTATSFIAGLSYINNTVPPEKRAIAQGVYGSAANLGVLAILLFSDTMAKMGGWRGAFVIEGVVTLLVVGLMAARLSRNVSRVAAETASWKETLSLRPLYLLGLAHILTYGVYTALATWTATFLWQSHGVGLEWAGPLAAILALSAVAGRGVGGMLSVGRERLAILFCCAGAALTTLLFPLMPGLPLALLSLLVLGWFASVPFGAIFSYISLISDKGATGKGFSVINFVANLGALVFPPVVGYALDATGSFALGFGIVGAFGLAGSAVVALLLPRSRPNR